MPTTTVLTLGQVLELPSDSWVNDPFEAHVLGLEKKTAKSTNRPFWAATLGGETGAGKCELTVFTAPKFAQGDVIEVGGQGVKIKETQYGPKISVGDKSEIRVVRKAGGNGGQPNGAGHAPAGHAASDRTAPAGGPPAQRPGDLSEFHRTMKKMALFYCHAMKYAAEIDRRIAFVTPEQQQACVSTLFIEGCRRQLVDIAPALDAAPPPQEQRREPTPEPRKAAPPPPPPQDEDVLF